MLWHLTMLCFCFCFFCCISMDWVPFCQPQRRLLLCLKQEMNMIFIGASQDSRTSVKVKEINCYSGEWRCAQIFIPLLIPFIQTWQSFESQNFFASLKLKCENLNLKWPFHHVCCFLKWAPMILRGCVRCLRRATQKCPNPTVSSVSHYEFLTSQQYIDFIPI